MPRLRGAGVAILGFVLLASSAAAGPPSTAEKARPIEDAKTAVDASDYFGARATLDKTLQAGGNKPADLAEIYRLTGIVNAALGDAKAAKEAFQKCLALAPQSTLPSGTSPKIGKPFAAAQDFLKGKPALELKTSTTNEPPTVTIEVASDPLQMIVKLQAVVVVDGKPEQQIDQPVAPSVKIDLPKGKRLDLRVNALDDKGNHLFEVGTKDVPVVIVGKVEPEVVVKKPPPPKPKPKPFQDRPLYLKWWLYGGLAIAFGGAGAYFGIDAIRTKGELDDLGAESANHTFDEAKALEDDARRSVLFTNIGLIGGGALALTATVLYLTRPKRPTEERRPVSVVPLVHPQAAGLVLGGHF
jgi:hypothetical protein